MAKDKMSGRIGPVGERRHWKQQMGFQLSRKSILQCRFETNFGT
jgi:hypothetical protein